MKSSGLAIPNGAVVVLGFVALIVGIVVSTHTIPDSSCILPTTSNNNNRDSINQFAVMAGLPGIIGGFLAMIGGGLGAMGGIKKASCMVKAASPIVSIAIILCFIAVAVGSFGKAVSAVICDDSVCNNGICMHDCEKGLFSNDCSIVCEEDYDAFCAYGEKSTAKMVVGVIAILAMLVACGMDCGAGCCCPASFEMQQGGAGQTPPPGSAPAAILVGQPVEAENGN